uniref:Uncharacterized protein n=1 Tax=Oryza glumipatula TaxID=40148 RepID=A0A0D9ZY30_9ORYZ
MNPKPLHKSIATKNVDTKTNPKPAAPPLATCLQPSRTDPAPPCRHDLVRSRPPSPVVNDGCCSFPAATPSCSSPWLGRVGEDARLLLLAAMLPSCSRFGRVAAV